MCVRIVRLDRRENQYQQLYPIVPSLFESFIPRSQLVRCISHCAFPFTGHGKSGFSLTNLSTNERTVHNVGSQNYTQLANIVGKDCADAVVEVKG